MMTVLIAGATSGIGLAVAKKYTAAQFECILLVRNLEKAKSVTDLFANDPKKIKFVELDLSNPTNIKTCFEKIDSFDIAVNCAATEGPINEIHQIDDFEIINAFNINVTAQLLLNKYQIQHFRHNSKHGVIMNVSSVAGLVGLARSSVYVASKHAMNGFTKSLAIEQIRNGIRINAICPGGVDTPMLDRVIERIRASEYAAIHPINRIASPSEIADAIFWINSKEADFIVGACIPMDGGRTAGLFP